MPRYIHVLDGEAKSESPVEGCGFHIPCFLIIGNLPRRWRINQSCQAGHPYCFSKFGHTSWERWNTIGTHLHISCKKSMMVWMGKIKFDIWCDFTRIFYEHLHSPPVVFFQYCVSHLDSGWWSLEHSWIMTFHNWEWNNHPNWRTPSFFRGVVLPSTSFLLIAWKYIL